MSDALTTFRSLLREDVSSDYWGDEGITQAARAASRISPDDWEEVFRTWADEGLGAQARLAEVLGETRHSTAVAILLEMLRSPNEQLRLLAVDSLRSHQGAFKARDLPAGLVQKLREIAGGKTIYARPVREFLVGLSN